MSRMLDGLRASAYSSPKPNTSLKGEKDDSITHQDSTSLNQNTEESPGFIPQDLLSQNDSKTPLVPCSPELQVSPRPPQIHAKPKQKTRLSQQRINQLSSKAYRPSVHSHHHLSDEEKKILDIKKKNKKIWRPKPPLNDLTENKEKSTEAFGLNSPNQNGAVIMSDVSQDLAKLTPLEQLSLQLSGMIEKVSAELHNIEKSQQKLIRSMNSTRNAQKQSCFHRDSNTPRTTRNRSSPARSFKSMQQNEQKQPDSHWTTVLNSHGSDGIRHFNFQESQYDQIMHTAPEDMPFVPPAISYVRYQENIIPEDKMGVNPRLREMRRPQLHKDASAIEQANEQMKFEIDERIHERVHGAEPERQSLFDFVVAQRAGLHNVGDPPPRRSTTLESYLGPTDEIGSPTERREKRKTMMMNDYRDYLQNWLDNN